MTYVFESKVPHLTFEFRAGQVSESGKPLKPGKSIEFRGNYLATDNEEVIKAITASSMFGSEPQSNLIWLRLKSEDSKQVAEAQVPKKLRGRPRKVISGAVGTE